MEGKLQGQESLIDARAYFGGKLPSLSRGGGTEEDVL
jgi:hypothetical protein